MLKSISLLLAKKHYVDPSLSYYKSFIINETDQSTHIHLLREGKVQLQPFYKGNSSIPLRPEPRTSFSIYTNIEEAQKKMKGHPAKYVYAATDCGTQEEEYSPALKQTVKKYNQGD